MLKFLPQVIIGQFIHKNTERGCCLSVNYLELKSGDMVFYLLIRLKNGGYSSRGKINMNNIASSKLFFYL